MTTQTLPAGVEATLHGTAVSGGIAIGTVQRISAIDLDSLISFRHEVASTDEEIERFLGALDRSAARISTFANDPHPETTGIFSAQKQMLSDPAITSAITDEIAATRYNAEFIIAKKLHDIKKQFDVMDSDLMRERFFDIQDIFHRILGDLLAIDHVRANPFRTIPPKTVLVSDRLHPSDIVGLTTAHIAGIVAQEGSGISHTAILARSLGIPFVVGISGAMRLLRTAMPVMVDGNSGIITLNPSPETIERATAPQLTHAEKQRFPACRMADGSRIRLLANVSSPDDVSTAYNNGADGIGLFRTEFVYLQRPTLPSPDEETAVYRAVFERSTGKRVTFRLYDFGGDKVPVFRMPGTISRSPLGMRGIRYLLDNPELLRRQLSCITAAYNAETGTRFDLLIPFVTMAKELTDATSCINSHLASCGIARDHYRIGMMIEVPAAYFSRSSLLPSVDFASIGTNDLSQYLFARDRDEQLPGDSGEATTDVLVSLVAETVSVASRLRKECAVCGEIAADPGIVPRLLGVGVRAFSVSPETLKRTRSVIAAPDTPSGTSPQPHPERNHAPSSRRLRHHRT